MKAIGLARVSSISQTDNTSISQQHSSIRYHCEQNNIQLSKIISEVYSGTTSDRDGLNQLKQLVEQNKVSTVIVYKIDRLMRSFTDGVVFIKFLTDNDVQITSVSEQIDTNTISGRFFLNILLSMSEMERNTIVQRLENGKHRRFTKDKKMVCSSPPFGYRRLNGDVVVVEEEREIVKFIFKSWNKYSHLLQHKRTRKIRLFLEKYGYTFRGKSFNYQHIKRIVNNSFYMGIMSHGQFGSVKHDYDTIVSTRLYNKCN